jgi:flagellar basal-body rod modification protein FlgD
MTIASVGTATSAATASSSLGLEDFMKVLLTQLTFQDPLKPMDNQAFMAQMAQFSALEQSQRLNDGIQQLASNQAALQSVGLIGRTVDVQGETGTSTGTVTALSLKGEVPVLTLTLANGSVLDDVSLSRVIGIR